MNLYSPYIEFDRKEWAGLREHQITLPLTEAELEQLKGLNEEVSIQEVEDIYLPLTHFIDLYARASRDLDRLTAAFMKKEALHTPYIIGIGGSVAVGKSTAARLIQALLARGKNKPKVDLVTTDGFLYPNAVLEKKGIMNRKVSRKATTSNHSLNSWEISNLASLRLKLRYILIWRTTSFKEKSR